MFVWTIATRLPTTIVATESEASIHCQSSCTGSSPVPNSRSSSANAAAFEVAAM